jgi:hypothetical protein
LIKGGEKLKNSFRFVEAVLAYSAMKSLLKRTSLVVVALFFILSIGSLQAQEDGFVALFDGQSLTGWVGNKNSYLVKDGMIVIEPKGAGGGNLYTEKEYGNFILRFEFQLTPGANNGLGIHAPLEGDAAYVGKEFQILDNEAEKYAGLQTYQYHGSLYGVMPAKRGFLRPTGEWNQQEVRINHPFVTVILNGEVILEGNYLEASQSGTLDKKEHPGLARSRGHIGFLGHGDLVRFRNIKIKELP